MKLVQVVFLFGLSFSLICCQGMHFTSLHHIPEQRSSADDEGFNFQEQMRSDKLNVVIVADTRDGMDEILQETFNASFIQQFENYNWKMAYTNTSVGKELLEDSVKGGGKAKKDSKTCSSRQWLWRLGAVAVGAYLVAPLTLTGGVFGTGSCLFAAGRAGVNAVGNTFQKYKKKPDSVDGQFLFFEEGGTELDNYLTKEQEGYGDIFVDTFKQGTASYNQFDAPQVQKGSSDPLAAVLLSLLREQTFFQKGSQAIFIVMTPEDSAESVPFSHIQKGFQKIHGEDNSLQIIPVALTKDSEMSCVRELEDAGVDSPEVAVNLQKSISKKVQPINICSPDLSNQLARQIKRFVYPAG